MTATTAVDVDTLLATLANDRRVLVPRSELSDRLGSVKAVVAEAEAEGLVETWTESGIAYVAMSGLLAKRLGLAMNAESSFWRSAGYRERIVPPKRRRHENCASDVFGANADYMMDNFADSKSCNPLDVLAESEHDEELFLTAMDKFYLKPPEKRPKHWKPTRFIKPRLLLGMGVSWPVKRESKEPCPICKGRQLSPVEYCLVCGAWGCDELTVAAMATVRQRKAG
jgi:hypothetical protein